MPAGVWDDRLRCQENRNYSAEAQCDLDEIRQHRWDRSPLSKHARDAGAEAETEREREDRAAGRRRYAGGQVVWRSRELLYPADADRHRNTNPKPSQDAPEQEHREEREAGSQHGAARKRGGHPAEQHLPATIAIRERRRTKQARNQPDHVHAEQQVGCGKRVVRALLVHVQERREVVSAPGHREHGRSDQRPRGQPAKRVAITSRSTQLRSWHGSRGHGFWANSCSLARPSAFGVLRGGGRKYGKIRRLPE